MKRFLLFLLVVGFCFPAFALKTVNQKRVPEGKDWGAFGVSPKYAAMDSLLTCLANILPSETTNGDAINVDSARVTTLYATTATISAMSGVTTMNMQFDSIITVTDSAEALVVGQSGALVICSTADATTTITLPDPGATTVGCVFYLLSTVDYDLEVVATTADSDAFVADAVATSDKVSCATSSHKIGSGMVVIGISATQWYVGALNPACPLTVEAAD